MWLQRTEMLIGGEGLARLREAKVAIFGVGGVGGYVAEILARSGVGALDLFDPDVVSETNLNRQIAALHSTLGRPKTEVLRDRILDINPDCRVNAFKIFYGPENADIYQLGGYSYVVDAIDTVSSKLLLIENADRRGVPIISAMGAGNKLDPGAFEVADIFKTSVCPLARVMRYELKKRGIRGLKVVFSRETPIRPTGGEPGENGKIPPGSTAFAPAAAGILLASEVVKDIIGGGNG